MKTIICNEFSLHMLDENCTLKIDRIPFSKFQEILNTCNYTTCIGNKNIANVLNLDFNRSKIVLGKDTRLLVTKLIGGEVPSDKKSIESEFEFYDIRRCS